MKVFLLCVHLRKIIILGKVSALDLTKPTVQKALLELVGKFIVWGVDGINLADSGFGESADLAGLIKQIRALNGADKM